MPRLSRIGPLSVSKINKSESGKSGQAKQIVHLMHFKQKKVYGTFQVAALQCLCLGLCAIGHL